MLTFLIPLRHPDSSKNWPNVCARLSETLASVASACATGSAQALLIANEGSELPELPPAVRLISVKFPPPSVSVFRGDGDDHERRRAVWLDKGLKIATGAIAARAAGSDYVMAVDADDLVSNRISDFVVRHKGAPGWFVEKGWLLPVNSSLGAILYGFHNWCGTYAIVRTDLLPLEETPDRMDPELVRNLLGHHRDLIPMLASANTPLAPLPFPGAVYRIGHGEGNFQRSSLRTELFGWRRLWRNPKAFVRQALRVRPFLRAQSAEFRGESGTA